MAQWPTCRPNLGVDEVFRCKDCGFTSTQLFEVRMPHARGTGVA